VAERVRVKVEEGIAQLTLTRADKHNGMDIPMLRSVVAAQKQLRAMRTLRAVIVHGEGPSFCSGIDTKSFLGDRATALRMVSKLWLPWRNVFQTWSMGFRELGVAVIAAIHGNCFGAGIQLALGADIRIARPDARLSLMEAKLGLVPDMGGPTLLRELVRLDVAKELVMTGRILSGTEAHALGLVTHVSEDPLEHARNLAQDIAARSPDAVAAAKFLLQRSWDSREGDSLAQERRYQRLVIGRKNQRAASAQHQGRAEPESSVAYVPRSIER
jgi:enoyl-CoA hydratase/carnithine racemase